MRETVQEHREVLQERDQGDPGLRRASGPAWAGVAAKRAKRVRRGGFTIVECLIAGVIMALFAAAMAGSITQATRAAARSQDQRQAAQWLDTVFTRIDMLGPYRLSVQGPLEGQLDERFSWAADVTLDDALPDLYRVTVTIRYTGLDARPGQVVGHSQFHDPAGSRTLDVPWEEL